MVLLDGLHFGGGVSYTERAETQGRFGLYVEDQNNARRRGSGIYFSRPAAAAWSSTGPCRTSGPSAATLAKRKTTTNSTNDSLLEPYTSSKAMKAFIFSLLLGAFGWASVTAPLFSPVFSQLPSVTL